MKDKCFECGTELDLAEYPIGVYTDIHLCKKCAALYEWKEERYVITKDIVVKKEIKK